jgi:GNAT superfamily N-acetyltransferase
VGCVNLQITNEGIYLGMFSVHPLIQNEGIGKQLLQAAEEFAQPKIYIEFT